MVLNLFAAFPQRVIDQLVGSSQVFLPVAPAAAVPRHLGLEAFGLFTPLAGKCLPGFLPARFGHAGKVKIIN